MNKHLFAHEKIISAENILLLTHQRPDGDALSSVCAFTIFLERLQKNFVAFSYDPPPTTFNFLKNIEKITISPPLFGKKNKKEESEDKYSSKKEYNFEDFDVIVILDCGSIYRTQLGEKILENKQPNQTIIEFDHHPSVENNADIEIRSDEASSTTEILYEFFRANEVEINKEMANCILTGILTDTANFLHPTTTKNAINIASHMLLRGAAFPKITKNTWQNKSLNSMKLWGHALDNLKINKRYNIAFTVLTWEEIQQYDGDDKTFDAIAGFLSNLNEVKAVLFLREEEKGKIKGSLRTSRPEVDVSKMANFLGGGGHAKASGFMVEGSIEKTENGWKII